MIGSSFKKLYSPDKSLFYFNLKILFLVGLWPEEKWSTKYGSLLYKAYARMLDCAAVIFLVITAIGMYQKKDDLTIVLTNFDKTLVAYNFFLKTAFFTFRSKKIRILINEILHSGDQVSEERKKLMILHVLLISAVSMGITFVFAVQSFYKNELILDAWLPFDPFKSKVNLLLSVQVVSGTFVPCALRAFAMQGMVCSILMYICDNLVKLQNKIRNLQYDPANERATQKEFKEIVKKHVRIMGYAKLLAEYLKEYFLIQNLAVTLELCLNAIMITVVGFKQKTLVFNFICFLCLALSNAYIYCYLGEKLITQSTGLSLAAYEAKWTDWPVDMQKQLLIVIRVAQKPLQMSAGGIANMSLQTFCQALYNGYSIFAVLSDAVD